MCNKILSRFRFWFCLPLLLAQAAVSAVAGGEVASPDGRVRVEFAVADGKPVYSVSRDGGVVIEQSRLGVVRGDVDYSSGVALVGATAASAVFDRYEMNTGKRRWHEYRAKRRVFRLEAAGGWRLDVAFQVSNDGVAFRYEFPDVDPVSRLVTSEATTFKFAAEARGWLQPMSVAKTGWARTNPSYEEYYQREVPVGTPSTLGAGWVFPALFRSGATWLLISEAGLARGHAAGRLAHLSPEGEYGIGQPDERETIGSEPVQARFATPHVLPWRIVALGDLATVTESSLGTDLAAPAIPTARLAGAPGKASWSWPKLGDRNTVLSVQKRFVDFAVEMAWTHCLVDALWDTQIGEAGMKELLAYAKARGIGLHVWYNTNGDWNDAFQTPKNRMSEAGVRRAEFARLRELGVQGVKVDFFGGDGRAFVDLYIDILEDAAAHGLLVNFHGATLPRGWQRTYPNLMTVEAVKGFEFITFEQVNADQAPRHIAMIPFTRNVFDVMDFTPLSPARLPKIQLRTTAAGELATAVLFTSGLQHYVETPEGMAAQPAFYREAVKGIPSEWEESRLLAGHPGDYVVMARQGGDGRWWVAGFNGDERGREVTFSLARCAIPAGVTLAAVADGDQGAPKQITLKPDEDGSYRIQMPSGGGFLATTPQP